MPEPTTLDNFERIYLEYPEELPDQLQWLETHLHADHGRLVRLLGLSPKDTATLEGQDWTEITRRFERQARWLEEILTTYLHSFQYDTEKAASFPKTLWDRIKAGELHFEHLVYSYPQDGSPAEQEEALVRATLEAGPQMKIALALFLGQPVTTP